MTDGGPSAAEMGIDLEDISEKAGPKTVEDASKTPRLKDLIPIANSQEELQDLTTIHGLSSENELSRSAFYRNKPQTEVLRKCLQDLPKDKPFDILNIGPANGEEAVVYGILANNAGALGRTRINYVDIRPSESVKPRFGLGENFMRNPIEPPQIDREGYVFENGQWRVNNVVRQFVENSLGQTDNSFGQALENFCREDDGKRYGLVTCNNITQYLGQGRQNYANPLYQNEGDFRTFQAVLLSVAEKVDNNGLLFMDVSGGGSTKRSTINRGALDRSLHNGTNFGGVFETLNAKNGIYQRRNMDQLKLEIMKV